MKPLPHLGFTNSAMTPLVFCSCATYGSSFRTSWLMFPALQSCPLETTQFCRSGSFVLNSLGTKAVNLVISLDTDTPRLVESKVLRRRCVIMYGQQVGLAVLTARKGSHTRSQQQRNCHEITMLLLSS